MPKKIIVDKKENYGCKKGYFIGDFNNWPYPIPIGPRSHSGEW